MAVTAASLASTAITAAAPVAKALWTNTNAGHVLESIRQGLTLAEGTLRDSGIGEAILNAAQGLTNGQDPSVLLSQAAAYNGQSAVNSTELLTRLAHAQNGGTLSEALQALEPSEHDWLQNFLGSQQGGEQEASGSRDEAATNIPDTDGSVTMASALDGNETTYHATSTEQVASGKENDGVSNISITAPDESSVSNVTTTLDPSVAESSDTQSTITDAPKKAASGDAKTNSPQQAQQEGASEAPASTSGDPVDAILGHVCHIIEGEANLNSSGGLFLRWVLGRDKGAIKSFIDNYTSPNVKNNLKAYIAAKKAGAANPMPAGLAPGEQRALKIAGGAIRAAQNTPDWLIDGFSFVAEGIDWFDGLLRPIPIIGHILRIPFARKIIVSLSQAADRFKTNLKEIAELSKQF